MNADDTVVTEPRSTQTKDDTNAYYAKAGVDEYNMFGVGVGVSVALQVGEAVNDMFEAGALPTVLPDYAWNGSSLGKEAELSETKCAVDETHLPSGVLQGRRRPMSATFVSANVAVLFFAALLQRTGRARITNEIDGEHSIKVLKTKAAQLAAVEMGPEDQKKIPSGTVTSGEGSKWSDEKHQERHLGQAGEDNRYQTSDFGLATDVRSRLDRSTTGGSGAAATRRTGNNSKIRAFQVGVLSYVRRVAARTTRRLRASHEMTMKRASSDWTSWPHRSIACDDTG